MALACEKDARSVSVEVTELAWSIQTHPRAAAAKEYPHPAKRSIELSAIYFRRLSVSFARALPLRHAPWTTSGFSTSSYDALMCRPM